MEKTQNLLFVFSDEHRKHDLGCYGNTIVKTPNLDRLAEEGLCFSHCVSNSPVCVPARGSLLTGLFPQKHGAFTNDLAIHSDCISIANVLNDAGYHTGYIGKWHLAGIPRDQFITEERRLGFKEWKVANCNHDYLHCYYDDEENVRHVVPGYEPEIFGELALEFVERNQEIPWALYVSFASPHGPHTVIKQEYWDQYEDVDIPLLENAEEPIQTGRKTMTLEEQKREAKGYYGHITAIDDQVGRLMKKLKETGQLEDTIIIYTSDHGTMLGSHGFTDKQQPYEESIGVPLIAYWKNHIRTGHCEEMIGLVDLPVTLLGLLGKQFPDEVDGADLHTVFTDENGRGREGCYIFDLYPCHQAYLKGFQAWRGVRTKRYTYAVTASDQNWLLFDNEKDPYQKKNVVNDPDYAEVKKQLWNLLDSYIKKHDALISGEEYVMQSGQLEEFNESQIYFGFPPIDPEQIKKEMERI